MLAREGERERGREGELREKEEEGSKGWGGRSEMEGTGYA